MKLSHAGAFLSHTHREKKSKKNMCVNNQTFFRANDGNWRRMTSNYEGYKRLSMFRHAFPDGMTSLACRRKFSAFFFRS